MSLFTGLPGQDEHPVLELILCIHHLSILCLLLFLHLLTTPLHSDSSRASTHIFLSFLTVEEVLPRLHPAAQSDSTREIRWNHTGLSLHPESNSLWASTCPALRGRRHPTATRWELRNSLSYLTQSQQEKAQSPWTSWHIVESCARPAHSGHCGVGLCCIGMVRFSLFMDHHSKTVLSVGGINRLLGVQQFGFEVHVNSALM
jgi:hypothetical protein